MHDVRRPFSANNDQLLLSGLVLMAFEGGGMPMHPADYTEIASWTANIMSYLDIRVLFRLRSAGLYPLRDLAENALSERGIQNWLSDIPARLHAESEWELLLGRLLQCVR